MADQAIETVPALAGDHCIDPETGEIVENVPDSAKGIWDKEKLDLEDLDRLAYELSVAEAMEALYEKQVQSLMDWVKAQKREHTEKKRIVEHVFGPRIKDACKAFGRTSTCKIVTKFGTFYLNGRSSLKVTNADLAQDTLHRNGLDSLVHFKTVVDIKASEIGEAEREIIDTENSAGMSTGFDFTPKLSVLSFKTGKEAAGE